MVRPWSCIWLVRFRDVGFPLETSSQYGNLRAPIMGGIEFLYVSRYVSQLTVARSPMRSSRVMCNRSRLHKEESLMMSFLNMSGAATDLNVLDPEHENFDEAKRLDRFKICGDEYLRSDSLAGLKESRVKKSSIWRFGEKLLRVRDRKEVYYCYQCERQKRKQLLPKLSGNTGAHQHLLSHHNIDGDGRIKSHPPAGQHGIDQNTFTLVSVAKKSEFQRLLIRWLVYCHISISMVENEYFRDLVAYLNKGLAALLPLAQATIRKWITNAHRDEKEKIKEEMKMSTSDIHISFTCGRRRIILQCSRSLRTTWTKAVLVGVASSASSVYSGRTPEETKLH